MKIDPQHLGNAQFKHDYNIRYAYMAGSMYKGISSKELVIRLSKAGLIGFLGTGGLKFNRIEADIQYLKDHLQPNEPYGLNLLNNIIMPKLEEKIVALYLDYGVKHIEAAAFMQITPALVWFRLKGLYLNNKQEIEISHTIIGKVSRPEVAIAFMSPAPDDIINFLLNQGKITAEEARLGRMIPISHDICVESDSGGHTDQRIALTMLPTIIRLRDSVMAQHHYTKKIRVGAAGGIGTPEAAAAYFILGADFILTGSINQCTVEAGMSDAAKDMLQSMNVQDTAYAPAGDMFELGARVQVLKKGTLFAARANKLYDLYKQHSNLEEIDIKTRNQIQQNYFKRSFDEVWNETKNYYLQTYPTEINKAELNPKSKMALIFRWYFVHSTRLAMKGVENQTLDYQIHCGSALGAFNEWVKDTPLENWHNRHVDEIALKLINETAVLLTEKYAEFS